MNQAAISTKTTDLMNPGQLAREFGIFNVQANKILDEAGIAPVHSVPYGRGLMRLYEPEAARNAIRAALPKREDENPQRQQEHSPQCLDVLEERIEELTGEVRKLAEQNRALFAYLRDSVGERVEKLITSLGGV